MKRSDVETRYYHGSGRTPALNVKVYDWPNLGGHPCTLRDRERSAAIFRDVAGDLGRDPGELAAWWAGKAEESDEFPGWTWCGIAAESALGDAQSFAEEVWPDRSVTVRQQGQSGGWLTVEGLPDLESWDAVALARWARFSRFVAALVDDYPRSVLWLVAANVWEAELAEAEEAERRAWEPGPAARYMAETGSYAA